MGEHGTVREHLVGLAQVDPELALDQLAGPPLMPIAARAWEAFTHLNSTRASGMGGVGAITYAEMAAYMHVTGDRLTPLDVALVREADAAFLSFAMRRMNGDDTTASDDTPPHEE